ncbi:hypothetical protein ACWGE1_30220 [Streptomyces sp. NPDC054932]
MLTPDQVAAIESLRKAAAKAARSGNVSFSPSFVRSFEADGPPPLARLIQGGRGGEVRLKTYLSIVMMATAAPFDVKRPPTPQAWSRLLLLPKESGPRRIANNIKWLSEKGFIELGPRRGYAPCAIQLLSMDGKGGEFERASLMGRYVGVPIQFWTNGWILALSATAIALLFALLESQGGHATPRYVTKDRRESYGISHNSWTEGRKELERHKFLTVTRVPQGSDFDYQRLRNSYWIDDARFLDAPGTALHSGATKVPDVDVWDFVTARSAGSPTVPISADASSGNR